MKGKLIVIEGLDKSGKETQAKLIIKFLMENGIDAIYEDEPTNSNPIGRLIKDWLNRKIDILDGKAITLLYAADRYEHIRKRIEPAINSGKIVVLDRYFYSTIAYEKALYNVDEKWIEYIHNYVIKPNIVIYLKVKPEECVRRAKLMGEQDRHEKIEKLIAVEKVYDELAEKYNFFIVNGEKNINEVFEDIKNIILQVLKLQI